MINGKVRGELINLVNFCDQSKPNLSILNIPTNFGSKIDKFDISLEFVYMFENYYNTIYIYLHIICWIF